MAKHSPSGRTQRDMTKAQFLAECKKRDFKIQGFMGYIALPSGLHVSVHNTGTTRRRTWLAYLLSEQKKDADRRERDAAAEKELREAGCVIEKRGKEHGWWKDDKYLGHSYGSHCQDALAALKSAEPA